MKVTDNQIYRISKTEHKIKEDTTDGAQGLAASGYYMGGTTTNKGTTIDVLIWKGVDFVTNHPLTETPIILLGDLKTSVVFDGHTLYWFNAS